MTSDKENNPENGRPGPKSAPEFPEPPDLAKVQELREKMRQTRSARAADKGMIARRIKSRSGHKAKEIGTYTLIPMLMLAGPIVGYVLGALIQNRWGGEPWGGVVGMLLGLVAGFRQVFLLLARFGKKDDSDQDGPGS